MNLYIGGKPVVLDRAAAYDLLSALSEYHGRLCTEISSCGDMERANELAARFPGITNAYNKVEQIAADIDERDARLLNEP